MRRLVLLAALLLLGFVATPAVAQDDPVLTCNQFMQAMQAQDYERAYKLLSKNFQKTSPYQGWVTGYSTYDKFFTIVRWAVDVKPQGDRYAGRITVTFRSTFQDQEASHDDIVELVKESDGWRIDSVNKEEKKADR